MTTKKKKKKGLIIGTAVLAVLILALCATAFFFVQAGKNSEQVQQYRQEVEAQAQLATEKHQGEVKTVTEEVVAQVLVDSGDSAEGITQTSGLSQAQKEAVEAALKDKYYGILQEQKNEAIGMVEALVLQGKADYQSLVASGNKNPTTLGNMVSEYMAKVDVMEAAMDSSFSATVEKMREQLEQQGIEANAIISEYEAEYKRIKEANRQSFMDKAFAMVKGA